MTNSPGSPQTVVWRVPACPFSIEYDPVILNRICAEAVDGYHVFPHGGVEIGGLLLGESDGGRLRITGSEPVECEHASGPSYLLSRSDESALRARLQARTDVVGWYHSHTRSGIHFSPDDVAVHERLFPEPARIALVLYPNAVSAVRVGVFFREANSKVIRHAERVHEFAAAMPVSEPAPAARQVSPRQTRHRNGVWAGLAAMLALAIGAVLFVRLHNTAPLPPSAGFVRLEAVGHDDKVDVHWDPQSLGAVRTAKLEIRDGDRQSEISLDAKALSAGVATYVRHGEVSSIHIRVERVDGAALEGSTTLVAPLRAAAEAVGKPEPDAPPPALPEPSPRIPAPAAIFQPPHKVSPELTPAAVLDPPASAAVEAQRPPAMPGGTPALPAPPPSPPSLAGRWEFRPGFPTRSPSAPEAITVSVSEDHGQIQGTFDARYKDAHAKTERVQFSFSGKASGGTTRVPWKTAEGARGEIEFIRVPNSPDSVEVVWFDSEAKRIFDDVLKKIN